MNLESIAIKNFRCFSDSRFEFNRNLNLIIGNNGSGKSSLLYAIASSLTEPMRVLAGGYLQLDISNNDVRFETQFIGRRVRFERRYPSSLDLTADIFGESFMLNSKKTGAGNFAEADMAATHYIRKKIESIDIAEPYALPLIAFYRAHRNMSGEKVSMERAASEKVSRQGGYESWIDAFVSQAELEKWVIGKTLERLAGISEGETVETVNDDELNIVNGAIVDCIPRCRGLRFDLRIRSLMVDFDDGILPFGSLSDGQQAIVSLVADIARRMCILNPHLGNAVLRETDGVLLIDEIDIHLHPALQRKIIKVLRSVFPHVQIFATSHSPQMIGGLAPSEILIMKNGLAEQPQTTYGLDSSRILEEIMGTDPREPEVGAVLSRMFLSIENGDLARAKSELADLRRRAPDLPEYTQLDALIRRKEVIGR